MVVKAVEAPTTLLRAESPSPVFKDENLSVYSIPLYPSVDEAPGVEPIARPSKRKRSPSPPTVSKRSTPPPIDHTVESTSPVPPSLFEQAQDRDFNPTTLTGPDAQEWRKLMLQEMFPMQPPPPPDPSMSKGAKQKAKAVQDSADEPPPPRKFAPDLKYARLPALVSGRGVEPATLPTLGYLCVGPSVRGRFDVKKAEELGVPRGPLRGRLTKGEAITFEVDDGQGGKIQRTVQPEQCVGPPEAAQVDTTLHVRSLAHLTVSLQAILVLDVPTPAHISSLLASFTDSPFFAKYRSKLAEIRKEHPLHAVYHFCGEGVLEDEQYKEFMNGFSDDTHVGKLSFDYSTYLLTLYLASHLLAGAHRQQDHVHPIRVGRGEAPPVGRRDVPDPQVQPISVQGFRL